MSRGAKPKVYPAALVLRVRDLYIDGWSQKEVARACGVSQKVIWRLMRTHKIHSRAAVKRDQRGAMNHAWRGNEAGYAALHLRVQAIRGTPSLCEQCGTTSARRFEWANLTGNYSDTNDYRRLCVSCHHRFDGTVRNLGAHAERKDAPR